MQLKSFSSKRAILSAHNAHRTSPNSRSLYKLNFTYQHTECVMHNKTMADAPWLKQLRLCVCVCFTPLSFFKCCWGARMENITPKLFAFRIHF